MFYNQKKEGKLLFFKVENKGIYFLLHIIFNIDDSVIGVKVELLM